MNLLTSTNSLVEMYLIEHGWKNNGDWQSLINLIQPHANHVNASSHSEQSKDCTEIDLGNLRLHGEEVGASLIPFHPHLGDGSFSLLQVELWNIGAQALVEAGGENLKGFNVLIR
ncbi:uncharacterized protein N7496_005207 [Penicillium cataractarum]|uniref:Uncharacterized protein n=1 Tax=Penicillium cataractarum TaxID=2100454 RepID=A0A9W9VD78_9EURO|nr:uncharacterized protein N7496_005207 [Penicillium cataractarum]KAJ5377798.1 hypothetical protein N7496_005207 [Penicillium cataractarum]